ncbi:hypothetical protein ACHAQH_003138 [Verticillium albo-atrum]
MRPPLRQAATRPPTTSIPRQLPDSGAENIADLKDRYCELGAALHADVSAALDDGHVALADRVSGIFAEHGDFLDRHAALTADFSQPLSESYVYEQDGEAPREKIFVGDVVTELRDQLAETERLLADDWERWDECKAVEERAAAALLDEMRIRPEVCSGVDCEVRKWEKQVQILVEETGGKITQLERALEKERNSAIRKGTMSFEAGLRQLS